MRKALFAIAALFVAAFATDPLLELRPQSNDEIINSSKSPNINELINITPSDEENLNIDESKIYQEPEKTKLLLSLSNIPRALYLNEIFNVVLSGNIQQDIDATPLLTINKNSSLIWLNKDNFSWQKDGNVYKTTLWFEGLDESAKIESIKMELIKNGELFQDATISFNMPTFKKLDSPKNYSHSVANRLWVKSHKVSRFDENSNLLTVEIGSLNTNLSTFFIDDKRIIKQGVESIRGGIGKESGYYFAVIPKEMDEFSFSYFNQITTKFEQINLKINLELETLSTQSGLNPKENSFVFYKFITILTIIGIFIVMAIIARNTTPLIFAVLLAIYLLYSQTNYEKIVVLKDSQIRILPLENSTIFYLTPKDEEGEILAKNGDYIKILLDNNIIGWIKKERAKE